MRAIPAIFFPSTIVIVDDNTTVIDFLRSNLNNKNITVLCANNSKDAQQLIEKSNYEIPNLEKILVENFQDDLYNENSSIVKFNISKLFNILENNDYYKFVTIVISDYSMPDESGLDFFKRIRHLFCKKVLITGQISHDKVVEAFNWGIIDKFLMKNDDFIIDTLNTYINELLISYFLNISKNIHLVNSRFNLLEDPDYITIFIDLINKYKICRYCMIDKSCSFLLISDNNLKFILLMRSNNDLDEFVQVYGNSIPDKYINLINARKIIPFFGMDTDNEHYFVKPTNGNFHKANKLSDTKSYYWSLINVD